MRRSLAPSLQETTERARGIVVPCIVGDCDSCGGRDESEEVGESHFEKTLRGSGWNLEEKG